MKCPAGSIRAIQQADGDNNLPFTVDPAGSARVPNHTLTKTRFGLKNVVISFKAFQRFV
jgi:hypothetical protein